MTHDVLDTRTRVFRTRPLEPDLHRVMVTIDVTSLDEKGLESSFAPSDYVRGEVVARVVAAEDSTYNAVFSVDPSVGPRIFDAQSGAKTSAGTAVGELRIHAEGNRLA